MADELINLDNLLAVLEEYGEAVAEQYKANLVRDGRPASGKLQDSISTHVRVDGGDYIVEMDLEEYWKWIEHGTGGRSPLAKIYNPNRKFPPVNKLLEWVRIKPRLPKPQGITEEQFARKIAGKIYWYGTEGKPSLEDAKRDVTAEWRERIEAALQHDMYNYIRKVLSPGTK